ncbi:hypothetical protein CUMW_259060, partial [Citrus unshiu]
AAGKFEVLMTAHAIVRSCGSFHQPEPALAAMDNSVIHVIGLRILSRLFRQMSECSLGTGVDWQRMMR